MVWRDVLARKVTPWTFYGRLGVFNFQDAVDLTAKLAGISGKPHLIQLGRQRVTLLDVLTSDLSKIMPFQGKALKSEIRFQYLWK